jgi:hypothetical protein
MQRVDRIGALAIGGDHLGAGDGIVHLQPDGKAAHRGRAFLGGNAVDQPCAAARPRSASSMAAA